MEEQNRKQIVRALVMSLGFPSQNSVSYRLLARRGSVIYFESTNNNRAATVKIYSSVAWTHSLKTVSVPLLCCFRATHGSTSPCVIAFYCGSRQFPAAGPNSRSTTR